MQRILFYVFAIFCCSILLLPNPGTVFLAACFSCLIIPLYRFIKHICLKKIHSIPKWKQKKRAFYRKLPSALFLFTLLISFLIPIALLGLVVAPQASRGFEQLKNLQISEHVKLLLPDTLNTFITTHLPSLKDYPGIESIIHDIMKNFDEYMTAVFNNLFAPSALWQRSVSLLGGSFTVLWTFFLFLTLTFFFCFYANQIKSMAHSVLMLPYPTLNRFIDSIRKALNAIFFGIFFVALIQGCLCGVGFAFAGIESFAFWGLMAAVVAPIPFIGTALVWLPLALVLWFKGAHIAAFGLSIWGIIIVAGVDNVCRPLFLQHGIKAPFFVLIIAIICGTGVFGPLGIIAGPVLLAFSLQFIDEAKRIQ